MYTIQELQAADFLLKKITHDNPKLFDGKRFKFVISIHEKYWYGDFIEFIDDCVSQKKINDFGTYKVETFGYAGDYPCLAFKKIYDIFLKQYRMHHGFRDPFTFADSEILIFETLLNLVRMADIQSEDSPIRPYLLNARSLDGESRLPFIKIPTGNIDVVSLIEVSVDD